MSGFNKVILMGHFTRDPELKTLPSGTPVCEIGLATNRRWKDAHGEDREEVLFVDCTAFGKRAEVLAQYFKKGSPIHLEGHLKLDRWEADDGTNRSKIRVMIGGFSFVDGGKAETGNGVKSNGTNGHPAPARRTTPAKRRPAAHAEPVLAGASASNEDIPFKP